MNDDLVRDVYERLGGIEAKLDDVRFIRDTANEAHRQAASAKHTALENEKDIERLTATIKWAISLIAPAIVSLAVAVLSILL